MKWIRASLFFILLWPVMGRTAIADTTIQGIPVNFIYTEYIFPESWRLSPINGKGESLGPEEINRSKAIITKALKKYPAAVLRTNLNGIYMLRSIKFYGVGYGGTNSSAEVFITNDGVSMGYTDLYIEQTFHHEFSSILIRNYPNAIDTASWKNANIPGFDYSDPENGVGAIRKNESSQELDTALCSKGFLTQYALSGIENDINTVAQNLFNPSPGFWKIVDRYPRINRKAALLVRFYHAIDPLFTEQYFRRQTRQ